MRAAAIFGLGTSPQDLGPFRAGSTAEFLDGLPAFSTETDAILLFGGDGTIHRHLSALVRLALPVLIVPAGSGNDFARALGLRSTQDSVRAWQNFEAGRSQPRSIDLGLITPSGAPDRARYFATVAGCGLDSAAARRANQMPRWLRAHGGYVLAVLPLLLKLPAFTARLTRSDHVQPIKSEKTTLLTAFANTPFYGDGMKVAPDADFADGQLDVCQIASMNAVKLLSMFPTVYFGRHRNFSEVEYSRADRISIETNPALEIYADGEFVCHTPAEISVAPGALRVVV